MNSSLLLPMIGGFATILIGMAGLFYATLRSAADTRRESRADFERIDAKIDSKIDTLESMLESRIDGVQVKLESKIDGQDSRISSLEEKFDSKIDGLRTEMREEMRRGFTRVHADYRDVRNRLDRLTDSLALRGLQLIEPQEG